MGNTFEFLTAEVTHVQSLIAIRTHLSSDDTATKDCPDVRRRITVWIVNDQIVSAIDSKNSGDFHDKSRLFPSFPHSGFSWLLAGFDEAAGRHPKMLVAVET